MLTNIFFRKSNLEDDNMDKIYTTTSSVRDFRTPHSIFSSIEAQYLSCGRHKVIGNPVPKNIDLNIEKVSSKSIYIT